VELEPVAQRERVRELILAHFVLVHHLRLDLELLVHREQRVVHHVAVIARDVRRGADRIENAQIGLRDELEYFLLRVGSACGKQHGDNGCSGERGNRAHKTHHDPLLFSRRTHGVGSIRDARPIHCRLH
jgi:hypothetical protein